MKKKFLFLMTLLAVSLLALAEMTVYVYKKDGTKVPYVASTVDSIGFVNVHTITFNANGGTGSMDVVRVKEGESIALPANVFTYAKAEFAGWNTKTDGSGTTYADKATVKPTANMTLYAQWAIATTGTENGYEWVDLGLPSGLKWATCNVGANAPQYYGDYYAWGETTTKSNYTNKSVSDKILPLSKDVANVTLGGNWRIPTTIEINELRNPDNCIWTETTVNGTKGYTVTSKFNGKSIFLPAGGYKKESSLKNASTYGYYWSSEFCITEDNVSYCYATIIGRGDYICETMVAGYGLNVRAVLPANNTVNPIFIANGGTGTMPEVKTEHGKSITLPANTFTREGYTFIGWNTASNGDGKQYADKSTITVVSGMQLYAQWTQERNVKTHNGRVYVDLGLPSGTKWATMNVGAISPEDDGDYFAWGDVYAKQIYSSDNYFYERTGSTLPLVNDAANANWGGDWRMPTSAEQTELMNTSYTTWTWTTQNGVKGYKVTSKINGNSIFLPAAGNRVDSSLNQAGSYGNYWNSSYYWSDYSSGASYLDFCSSYVSHGTPTQHAYKGMSVRPVLAK